MQLLVYAFLAPKKGSRIVSAEHNFIKKLLKFQDFMTYFTVA